MCRPSARAESSASGWKSDLERETGPRVALEMPTWPRERPPVACPPLLQRSAEWKLRGARRRVA